MFKFSINQISLVFLGVAGLFSFLISFKMLYLDLTYILEYWFMSLNSGKINFILYFDYIALLFISFVLMISSMVIFYSKSYLAEDLNMNRFVLLVLLFVLSMIMMIISPNMISILLGWDGLGLVSFCLVIYYSNSKSYNSGMLVVLSNRIGDVFILMVICWLLNYGGWTFCYYLYSYRVDDIYQYIGLLVMLGAITKSAQIPFSSWLPAAMAAPTPVSALVHSSTLVTAGVYLLIRFSELLSGSLTFYILLILGGATMVMSGLSASFEFDLKKIIALSTLSQLGLMMSILCLANSSLTLFHLLTHAMFKALLFMCAGVFIHNMLNNQDIRFMGVMSAYFPITGSCFMIANLALCGAPFLAGFYSKDLILETVSMINVNFYIWVVFFIATGLTVLYTVRVLYYSFFSKNLSFFLQNFSDSDMIMFKSMLVLMFLSVTSGSMLSWMILFKIYMIYLNFWLKMMVYVFIGVGVFMGMVLVWYASFIRKGKIFYFFSVFNFFMWFLSLLSTWGISKFMNKLSSVIFSILDKGWGEFIFNFKMVYFVKNLSMKNQVSQSLAFSLYFVMFVFFMMVVYLLMVL
uniref:NADH dehydrogenase subunit 5 n=1 Tax=Oxyethira ecornuta TaxID=1401674 RepID=UPI0022DCD927|nr:NADH dehydrogenase subunit 5 [Oxyethira ecornuta]UZZ44241.1 NADH dehydrogenase subunit 5 [Oxyethira ecornuta]